MTRTLFIALLTMITGPAVGQAHDLVIAAALALLPVDVASTT